MGISGLLIALGDCKKRKHIKDYADKTVGIDVSCWLHKGVYSCSDKICKGIPTNQYVDYCVRNIKILQRFHVIPLVVFDGGLLPAKAGTEKERKEKRRVAMQEAIAAEKRGDFRLARQHYVRAVDVTPYMCRKLMDKLDQMAVTYVVAPYEADSQLAFLARTGQVDAVISEDSDLIPYGCRRVLYKWDHDSGMGDEIDETHAMLNARKLDMRNWTKDQFLTMCIFAGCDYLPSLKGIAITKAYNLVNKYKTYKRVLRQLRFEAKIAIPSIYAEQFEKAMLTFRHARVWDPRKEKIVHLSPLLEHIDGDKLDFLGPKLSHSLARKICTGKIDPITKVDFVPDHIVNEGMHGIKQKPLGAKAPRSNGNKIPSAPFCPVPLLPENRKMDSVTMPKNNTIKYIHQDTKGRSHSYRGKKRFRNKGSQHQPFQHLHRSNAAAKPFKRPRGNDGSISPSEDENTSPTSSQIELQDHHKKQKLLGGCRPSSMKSNVNRSAYFADVASNNECDLSSTPPRKSLENETATCKTAAYLSRPQKSEFFHDFSSPFVGKSFVPLSRTSSSFTPSHFPVGQAAVASSQPCVSSSSDKSKAFSTNERSPFGMFRRKGGISGPQLFDQICRDNIRSVDNIVPDTPERVWATAEEFGSPNEWGNMDCKISNKQHSNSYLAARQRKAATVEIDSFSNFFYSG